MAPDCPLPLPGRFSDPEVYVDSLIEFTSSSDLFQTLCGGVHILDFFTSEPDLYKSILPASWRDWASCRDVQDILHILVRAELSRDVCPHEAFSMSRKVDEHPEQYRRTDDIPKSLLEYLRAVRQHTLDRDYKVSSTATGSIERLVAVGMKPKKVHEVENFAQYVDRLAQTLQSNGQSVTRLVDFGSGQNYLGRALASRPYNHHIVAVESKAGNIKGARGMDVTAKLASKERVMRDKKAYREHHPKKRSLAVDGRPVVGDSSLPVQTPNPRGSDVRLDDHLTKVNSSKEKRGSVQYIEHRIVDGDLGRVASQIQDQSSSEGDRMAPEKQQLMVISLHSCGNLVHHGLRSLVLNPSVVAVALVGCCYNLMTERLGPTTFKLPSLRPDHDRVTREGLAFDPHGFPMSERLASCQTERGRGVHMNITARMMAVQAPGNWTKAESEAFFTRHFYRALLQRIFLDRGIVNRPSLGDDENTPKNVIIGSLRKASYASFGAYVHGAVAKLSTHHEQGAWIAERMAGLSPADIETYEQAYAARKHELSFVWSLMAFSATAAESLVVVDRWCWLKEQEEVERCWVEAVFGYETSPRNLVVVGVKKGKRQKDRCNLSDPDWQ